MAENLKMLGRAVLTTSYVSIYAVPPFIGPSDAQGLPPQAAVSSIILCETAASTANVSIQFAPNGLDASSSPASYEIFDTLAFTANQTKIIAPGIMMGSGDRIRAKAASGTVNIFIFGSEIL